MRHHTLWY